MRVRLNFRGGNEPKKPIVVEMITIPRVGESLANGTRGVCEMIKVVHTPDASEQDVVIELGPPTSG